MSTAAVNKSTGEIAITPQQQGAVVAIADIRTHVNYLAQVKVNVLQKGRDFDVIPGCKKPSLFQPGAEKLCYAFNLSFSYEIMNESHDPFKEWDYGNNKHATGFHAYTVRCALSARQTGAFVGDGLGYCDSTEQGRQAAPGHTILQMARKRAFVSAVRNATNCSDMFTDTVEDYRPTQRGNANQQKMDPATANNVETNKDGALIIPFGKHKGKPITEVDRGYLSWVVKNMDNVQWIKIAREELERRTAAESDGAKVNADNADKKRLQDDAAVAWANCFSDNEAEGMDFLGKLVADGVMSNVDIAHAGNTPAQLTALIAELTTLYKEHNGNG